MTKAVRSRLTGAATRDAQSMTSEWCAVGNDAIDGVRVIDVTSVPKRHGFLTEIFRRDWFDDGDVVGQVFQVVLAPGAISAWHAHERTEDRIFVSAGSVTLALYDARSGSSTDRVVQELFLTIARPQLVVIPAGVWHGLAVTGTGPAVIINAPDRAYDYEAPDHWRLPSDTREIPYRFVGVRDGLD